MAQAIFADGLPNVVASASAIDIKRGLDRGVKAIVAALRQMSRPVATRKEKAQVAAISAHNEPAIGEMDAINQYADCYVAAQTHRSILRLWLQLVGDQVIRTVEGANEPASASAQDVANTQPPGANDAQPFPPMAVGNVRDPNASMPIAAF